MFVVLLLYLYRMDKIRIEIHLDESDVILLDEAAKNNGRSRKNFCELQIKMAIKSVAKPMQQQEPKKQFQEIYKPIPINQYEAFTKDIQEAKTIQEVTTIIKEINKDITLNFKQKMSLEQLAKQSSKNLYND